MMCFDIPQLYTYSANIDQRLIHIKLLRYFFHLTINKNVLNVLRNIILLLLIIVVVNCDIFLLQVTK